MHATFQDYGQCKHTHSHLHLIRMEAHQPLHTHSLGRARVVNVLALFQAALVHAHIRQLAKTSGL